MRPAVSPGGGERIAGVRDKALAVAPQGGLHHRVPPARDLEGETATDHRAHPSEIGREIGERARHIDGGDGARHGLDHRAPFDDARREPREDGKLDRQRLVGGRGDLAFELAELDGREAHGAGHGLAVREDARQLLLEEALADRLRHLDEVAEHVVVLDAQGPAIRLLRVAGLQRRDDAAALVAQRPHLVERGVIARPHETAVPLEQRQLLRQGGRDLARQRRLGTHHRLSRLVELGARIGAGRRERERDGTRLLESLPDRREVARPGAIEREPAQGAHHVGDAPQPRTNIGAELRPLDEIGDRIVPGADRHGVDQRTCQPRREKARSRARRAAVDGGRRLPARSPDKVRASSRLARVAASMRMAAVSLARTGMESGGRAPRCVRST